MASAADSSRLDTQHGPTQTTLSTSSASSSSQLPMKKSGEGSRSRAKASSDASRTTSSGLSAIPPKVKSLPPWAESFEDDDKLLPTPTLALTAAHHHSGVRLVKVVSHDGYEHWEPESETGKRKPGVRSLLHLGPAAPPPGRKWDHARSAEAVVVQMANPVTSPWFSFLKYSSYPGEKDADVVDGAVLDRQAPGYEKPWRGDVDGNLDLESSRRRRRKTLLRRLQDILLNHALVPLLFRITVLITSIVALGLAASVHHLSNNYEYRQSPSATMAIIVDVVAIPYIFYITYDEYTGKPLGLRSPKAKMRLILLDLFFIIFESANLALAFSALTDNDGSCVAGANTGYNHIVCNRVKALCGILFVALLSWSLTFAVSIFRLVERVGGRGGKEDSD